MSGILEVMSADFNKFVGHLSDKIIQSQVRKPDGVFEKIAFGWAHKADKALLSYNIKAIMHNTATVLAIVGAVGFIFGGSVLYAAMGIGGRYFVQYAMKETTGGKIADLHQNIDDSIYSLLFKPVYSYSK